jgi:hypothetical protein
MSATEVQQTALDTVGTLLASLEIFAYWLQLPTHFQFRLSSLSVSQEQSVFQIPVTITHSDKLKVKFTL